VGWESLIDNGSGLAAIIRAPGNTPNFGVNQGTRRAKSQPSRLVGKQSDPVPADFAWKPALNAIEGVLDNFLPLENFQDPLEKKAAKKSSQMAARIFALMT
jgi:hypothetical protein